MNTDFRVSVDFFVHHKTKKLQKRLGSSGLVGLLRLWAYAAKVRFDGDLSGMTEEDIELSAEWDGEDGAFCAALQEVGFLNSSETGFLLHDWAEHNAWAAEADDRSDKARFSRLATVNRVAFDELKMTGVNAISKNDYDRLTNAKRTLDECQTNVKRTFNERQTTANASPTPAPAPSPAPAPALRKTPPTPSQGSVFKKPMPAEVEAYCQERDNGINGQEFCNFYESKGWLIGKSPMKDWRAAIRTWESNRKTQAGARASPEYKTAKQKDSADRDGFADLILNAQRSLDYGQSSSFDLGAGKSLPALPPTPAPNG